MYFIYYKNIFLCIKNTIYYSILYKNMYSSIVVVVMLPHLYSCAGTTEGK